MGDLVRKRVAFGILILMGVVLLLAVSESNWLLAGVMGGIIGAAVALTIYAYPHDAAPPADRRHEASQRRRREQARRS